MDARSGDGGRRLLKRYTPTSLSDDQPPIVDPFLAPEGVRPARTSGNAIAALVTSLLGFVCLPAIGGLLGITLGIAAKSEIEKSGGRTSGSGIATTGIALGIVNLIVCTLGLAGVISWVASSSGASASPATTSTAVAPIAVPSPPAPPTATAPAAKRAAAAPGAASREGGVVSTEVGKITLVDVDRDVHSLRGELDKQREAAGKARQKLVLWMVTEDCQPCNGVAAALPDARMQQALEGVRLVRLDVRDFGVELSYLGVPVKKIPGFALLDEHLRPTDYVHGGEWDDDVAKNIAPVLGKFVRGSYDRRREPWRGGTRDDETTL